jgi:hypothetical protein
MTKRNIKIRHVKFSPEEMAYEPPEEVNFKSGIVLRGIEQWKEFLSFERGYVKIDPKLRRQFKDPNEINRALRQWLDNKSVAARKRRSA